MRADVFKWGHLQPSLDADHGTFDGGVYNRAPMPLLMVWWCRVVTTAPRYSQYKKEQRHGAAAVGTGSRILKKIPEKHYRLSDSVLKASDKAWQWAVQHPALEYNQNEINKTHKPTITAKGGYERHQQRDEWLWATSELLVTTGWCRTLMPY